MNGERVVRSLVPADAGGCVALATANGWQTDEPAWRTMIAVGEAFGVADADGGMAGTVILNRYPPGLAAIAMMLVHPAQQRKGLGRRLLEHALAAAGDAVVSLYATPFGEPLYAKVGFTVAGRAARVTRETLPSHHGGDVRAMRASDLESVRALDTRAQGASRRVLLDAGFELSDRALVAERAGKIDGFGFARVLGSMRVVGPIVAANDGDALALVAALGSDSPQPLRLDLAPEERTLREWLTRDGRASLRETPLMIRGARELPGERRLVRVLTSLAYG